MKALLASPSLDEVPLRKSPPKAEENEDDSEGRLEISLAGLVIEYKFMPVVSVGEVIDSNDEGAEIGELVSEWLESSSRPSSVGEKLLVVADR